MRLSRYFLPVAKETPADAQIASHRLMLRAGLVRQTSAGIYAWLPLGHRVLRKVEAIVREEQDRAGAIEMLMPTVQSADYWRATGRYEAYGPEMLRITDRQDRELLYGPTNEDMLTAIFQGAAKSYRDLPRILYHIQWKFRDEIRPRFGVMRGREFLMKDSYSFDLDEAGARISYNKMFVAYLRTFARMGLRAIPMQADTGPIGGDLSHEFIILAPSGESEVYFHKSWETLRPAEDYAVDADDSAALQAFVDAMTADYAATDEKRDAARETALGEDLRQSRGIEVGHIFYFGDKYSAPLDFTVSGPGGEPVTPLGGSYGIGVSRLVGAIIEASHDEAGIVWPESRRSVQGRPYQHARRRCGLRRGGRRTLRPARGGRDRDALRRSRRARRRQVRDNGSDRPALAADRRPARARERGRRAQEPRRRRARGALRRKRAGEAGGMSAPATRRFRESGSPAFPGWADLGSRFRGNAWMAS